jgi:hypothetical protein
MPGLSRPSMASEALGLLPGEREQFSAGPKRLKADKRRVRMLDLSRPSMTSEALGLLPGEMQEQFSAGAQTARKR